jgi:hypothetical protein
VQSLPHLSCIFSKTWLDIFVLSGCECCNLCKVLYIAPPRDVSTALTVIFEFFPQVETTAAPSLWELMIVAASSKNAPTAVQLGYSRGLLAEVRARMPAHCKLMGLLDFRSYGQVVSAAKIWIVFVIFTAWAPRCPLDFSFASPDRGLTLIWKFISSNTRS